MQQYIIYALVAAVICFAIWISIKTAINEAKGRAAAEVRADSAEDARQLQEDMANEVITPNTPDDVKDKLRKGEI